MFQITDEYGSSDAVTKEHPSKGLAELGRRLFLPIPFMLEYRPRVGWFGDLEGSNIAIRFNKYQKAAKEYCIAFENMFDERASAFLVKQLGSDHAVRIHGTGNFVPHNIASGRYRDRNFANPHEPHPYY